jgi:hypothetical protein
MSSLFGVERLGHAVPERRDGDLQPFIADATRESVPTVELADGRPIRTEMSLRIDLSPMAGQNSGLRARRGDASRLADPHQGGSSTVSTIDQRCAGCVAGTA